MKKHAWIILFLLPHFVVASFNNDTDEYFYYLKGLEFEKAQLIAATISDMELGLELKQLAEIVFYEGQKDSNYFRLIDHNLKDSDRKFLRVVKLLNIGYYNLFYDRVKGNAYRNFYSANQLAKEIGYKPLIKITLLALFKYHNYEIAQNSNIHERLLKDFSAIQNDKLDKAWLAIYKIIFYSKSINTVDNKYLKLGEELSFQEKTLPKTSSLMVYILYEKALEYDTKNDYTNARIYYNKVIEKAQEFPFLKYHKFFSHIKLSILNAKTKSFEKAELNLKNARKNINLADTLRSDYYLNFNTSRLYYAQEKYKFAYDHLMKAYIQDFELDFRRNTLEINKLNVELETTEKENQYLILKQNKNWLITALSIVFLLLLLSYFAYKNQQVKKRVAQRDKQLQIEKVEKLLKDQELLGIDAMIEGQEKERQQIANDLHDNLGSLLATLKLHFQNLKIRKGRLKKEEDLLLEKTDDLIEEAYQKVRNMAHAKNAGLKMNDGLLVAVKNFATKVSLANKLVIEVEDHGIDQRLENSLEISLFRIIQELITNVIKHSRASECTIHITSHDDSINLLVEDNGVGLSHDYSIETEEGMGLYSIEKRIENLKGNLTIDSLPDRGTSVIIDIPLA